MKTPEAIDKVFKKKNVLNQYNPLHKKPKGKIMNTSPRNELMAMGAAVLALSGLAYVLYRNQKKNNLYQKNFNPSTVFKFQGKIVDVLHTNDGNKESEGVELMLQTSDSVVPVHLGPAWYLEHQQVKFRKGERINITGSMNLSGKDASVVASSVRRGNKKLNLRDEKGHPYWYAWN